LNGQLVYFLPIILFHSSVIRFLNTTAAITIAIKTIDQNFHIPDSVFWDTGWSDCCCAVDVAWPVVIVFPPQFSRHSGAMIIVGEPWYVDCAAFGFATGAQPAMKQTMNMHKITVHIAHAQIRIDFIFASVF
jgi:hypothetical protein